MVQKMAQVVNSYGRNHVIIPLLQQQQFLVPVSLAHDQ
ncbi:hypothetical protein QFZ28_000754 [Neobacillus niacini]|nr:hypothetical protein [Neobacillus niacini]